MKMKGKYIYIAVCSPNDTENDFLKYGKPYAEQPVPVVISKYRMCRVYSCMVQSTVTTTL